MGVQDLQFQRFVAQSAGINHTVQQAVDTATVRTHTKLESNDRYLGIEVDEALEMAEQTES